MGCAARQPPRLIPFYPERPDQIGPDNAQPAGWVERSETHQTASCYHNARVDDGRNVIGGSRFVFTGSPGAAAAAAPGTHRAMADRIAQHRGPSIHAKRPNCYRTSSRSGTP